jgi:hypothetical protein
MASEPPPSRVPRAWHTQPAPAAGSHPISRRRRAIFTVLAAMAVLLGVIIAWFFYMSSYREPKFFTIAFTEYDQSLPVTHFGRRDSDALVRIFPKHEAAHDNQELQQFQEKLAHLDNVLQGDEKTLVVHLTGLARTGDRGKLYLLPGKAAPADPKSWLEMEAVLRAVKGCKKARRKLLLLDLHPSGGDPRLGTLPDDVAQSFQSLFRPRYEKDMLVLCPCSPGEVPLASEDLGHTVFGFYLEEGLRGFADGYNESEKRDGRVSVRELAAFVKARVQRWALQNRGVRQTPVLLGEGKDFDLAAYEQAKAPTAIDLPKGLSYPEPLRKAWEKRDRYLADGVTYQVAPRVIHQLGLTLVWLEQRWRARVDLAEVQSELASQLREFDKKIQEARGQLRLPGRTRSFYREAAAGRLAASPAAEAILADKLYDIPKDKKLDAAKLKQEVAKFKQAFEADLKKKLEKEKVKKLPDPAVLCGSILRAAADQGKDKVQVHFQYLNGLLREYQPAPQFLEAVYLQRLAGLELPPTEWPADTVRLLFRVIEEGEKAMGCRPREFPWVGHLLEAAEGKRRQGERLLFSGDTDNLKEANQRLEDALGIYQEANQTRKAVREAHTAQDEAVRLLPSYVPYLLARGGPGERVWVECVQKVSGAKGLDALLAAVPDKAAFPTTLGQLGRAADFLKDRLDLARKEKRVPDNLRRPIYQEDAKQLLGLAEEGGKVAAGQVFQAIRETEAILETPWPTAAERATLWKNRLELTRDRNAKSRQLDNDDNKRERLTRVPKDVFVREPRPLKERQVQTARLARSLLLLAGLPPEKLEKYQKAADAFERGDKKADADSLTRALREAWEDLVHEANTRKDLAYADRVSRVLHPFYGEGAGVPGHPERWPAARIRNHEAVTYRGWLASYYERAGEQIPPGDPKDEKEQAYLKDLKDLYQQAAQDYRP